MSERDAVERDATEPDATEPDAPEQKEWDLVVIGGGTAGLVAARTAAGFGASVLLIEAERLGGDCLWTGCVPSKSLIAAASAAATARGSAHLGVTSTGVTVDFPRVMAHVHSAMELIAPDDSAESLEEDGVQVLQGRAVFTGERTVEVACRSIRFHQAVIGTGGSPTTPEVPGAAEVEILTSSTFWDITELPQRLLVLGGGAIGCEIAQAMARLGSEVTLVHRGTRILAKEDEKAAAIVADALIADGVTLRLERSATAFAGDTVTLDDGSVVGFDVVLAAMGRRSNTDGLGLDRAGVDVDEKGNVQVDDRLRTSNPRIWSAGDVSGLPQFTHTAGVNGSIAATNAILGLTRRVDSDAVPRVTYTHPEVASVGVQPSEAAERGWKVVTREHADLDRAVCEADVSGYSSLVVDSRGRIHGGTIVGPRAGESLGEIGVAIRNKLTTSDLANTTHAYPTFTDGVWKAAVSDVQARLKLGVTGTATGVLRRIRQRRVA